MSRVALEESEGAGHQLPAWLILESQNIPWGSQKRCWIPGRWVDLDWFIRSQDECFWRGCSSFDWIQIGLLLPSCFATKGKKGRKDYMQMQVHIHMVGKHHLISHAGPGSNYPDRMLLFFLCFWMWLPWVFKIYRLSELLVLTHLNVSQRISQKVSTSGVSWVATTLWAKSLRFGSQWGSLKHNYLVTMSCWDIFISFTFAKLLARLCVWASPHCELNQSEPPHRGVNPTLTSLSGKLSLPPSEVIQSESPH
jgi:hypothetical protein